MWALCCGVWILWIFSKFFCVWPCVVLCEDFEIFQNFPVCVDHVLWCVGTLSFSKFPLYVKTSECFQTSRCKHLFLYWKDTFFHKNPYMDSRSGTLHHFGIKGLYFWTGEIFTTPFMRRVVKLNRKPPWSTTLSVENSCFNEISTIWTIDSTAHNRYIIQPDFSLKRLFTNARNDQEQLCEERM